MLSCNKISAVVKFSTFSKIKDSTHNEAYECTREDDKMAPSFCSVGDPSRYILRVPNRRLDSSIDAATVNNKIDFLRSMGLALSTQQQQGLKCPLCHQAKCICDIRTNLVDDITMRVQNEIPNISLKACRVLINCVQCKVCKKHFKCETDVRDHMKKRHRHRLKVTLKFDNETVSTKWIKKSHLRRHRRHSESNPEYSHEYQVSQIGMDDSHENSVETIFERNVFNSNAIRNDDRTKPQVCSERRPCSAPSLGVTFDLPFCQTGNCHCCVRNNIRPWDDNNNNDFPKWYLASKPRESIENSSVKDCGTGTSSHLAAHDKTGGSNTLSCQTPDWIQGSVTSINLINNRIEDNDVITLDDTEDLSNDIMEIPIEPPCYDLTEEERSDDEVEKVLEIRNNQLPFLPPKREIDDSENNGLRISDAIRDLIVAENSLSNHDQGDSELQASSRYFYEEDLHAVENDDDEEDDFTLRFDDSEESCTFVVNDTIGNKEYSKSYTDHFLEDTQMEMAIDHHDALEQSSNFWRTPTKNVERFSEFEVPIDYVGKRHSMIAIKEELTLDHYLFDRQ